MTLFKNCAECLGIEYNKNEYLKTGGKIFFLFISISVMQIKP